MATPHKAPASHHETIQVRQTRHAGHCWRSRDELISDVLLWTPTYGRAKAGRPARTYIQLLCEDMGCSPEDLPEAMNDREKWRERVRDIRASGTTWCWWWNDQTVLFSISHLFTFTLNVKQFYLNHRQDSIRCYPSGSKWTWEWWQWRDTLYSPKL